MWSSPLTMMECSKEMKNDSTSELMALHMTSVTVASASANQTDGKTVVLPLVLTLVLMVVTPLTLVIAPMVLMTL